MTPSAASPSLLGNTPVAEVDALSPGSLSGGKVSTAGEKEIISNTIQEVSSNQGRGDSTRKASWLNVAKKHVFTQQKVVVSEVDGKEKVVVPREVFAGAKPLWEDFLIGKFLNAKAPHVGKIHMIVNKIWRLGDRTSLIDVFEVNENTVKFRIRNEGMRHRILNRGMWNIMDIPMIVSKWTPFAEDAQPAMKSIPLWVTLSNVPTTMFTDKGLEFLFSAVGRPIRLHPKTEACVRFDEAQMLVEADLTKELPKEYTFTGEEEGELDSVIQYSYPWLPPKCSCCKKWGHLRETCLSPENNKFSQDPPSPVQSKVADKEIVPLEQSPVLHNDKEKEVVEQSKEVSKDLVSQTRGSAEGSGSGENKEEAGWITPSNTGRSPGKRKEEFRYGEVSILSNSFSALGDEAEQVITALEEEESRVVGKNSEVLKGSEEVMVEAQGKAEVFLRPSLPRGSKTAHKIISSNSHQAARDLPKDPKKKPPPKRC